MLKKGIIILSLTGCLFSSPLIISVKDNIISLKRFTAHQKSILIQSYLYAEKDDLGLTNINKEEVLKRNINTPEALIKFIKEKGYSKNPGTWPPSTNIGEFLFEGIKFGGERPFILDKDKIYTWENFKDYSIRAANKLIELGIRQDDKVVIHLPNSFSYAYWFFGTILAGGTVVPLHPALKIHELRNN